MADTPTPEVHTPSAAGAAPKSGGIAAEIKKLPPWAWLVIAGGAFVGYKLFLAGGSANNTNTPTDAAQQQNTGGTSPTSTPGDTGGGDSPTNPTPPPAAPLPNPGAPTGPTSPTSPGAPVAPANPTAPPAKPFRRNGGGNPSAPPAAPVPKPKSPPRQTYTVRQGDTLSSIGQRHGMSVEDLYDTNSAVIEQTAQQRSGHGSDGGTWIYPGEVLAIP